MEKPFSIKIKNSKKIRTLPSAMIVDNADIDPYYNHFTIRVSSLSEYIDVIYRLTEITTRKQISRLIYRGHTDSSSNYKLIPTIARTEKSTEEIEHDMVMEMINQRPAEFEHIKSDFDLLAKMQHFGLPTRILDFTYNPLIALFFACCSKTNTDSRVICTYDTSSSYTENLINSICGMHKYTDYCDISLDNLIGGVSQLRRYRLQTIDLLIQKPKYANSRIKHQAAVFMIFPNEIIDYRSRMVVLGRKNGNEFQYKRFILNENEERRLKYIREEPDFYKESFQLDSDILGNIINHYSNKFDDFEGDSHLSINPKYSYLFENRFSIGQMIQELDKKRISESFISIIIRNKCRNTILTELATIGIDKAFVFPELEYTAETIRNKYFK